MPDEILINMENEIIDRYTSKLKEILSSDDRIVKADVVYANIDVDKAKEEYERLYPIN